MSNFNLSKIYRFRAHIKREKVNDFIETSNEREFLECLPYFLIFNIFKILFYYFKLKIA